jgi:hypothetical protein
MTTYPRPYGVLLQSTDPPGEQDITTITGAWRNNLSDIVRLKEPQQGLLDRANLGLPAGRSRACDDG